MGPKRARGQRHFDQVDVHVRHGLRQGKAVVQLRPKAMLEAKEPTLAKVHPGRPEGRAVHAARELAHKAESGQAAPVREADSVPYGREPVGVLWSEVRSVASPGDVGLPGEQEDLVLKTLRSTGASRSGASGAPEGPAWPRGTAAALASDASMFV